VTLRDDVASTLPERRADSLLVTEIYASLQGETTFAGLPFVLVRLARCNLRCAWCDSEFTFKGGERRALSDVVREVLAFGLPHVLVTGGEPLLQPAVHPLMTALCDAKRTVLVETGGSLDIGGVDPRVRRIVDVKCPGSGEAASNRWENLALLGPLDEVKFVIADRADYDYAVGVIMQHRLSQSGKCNAILLSPVSGDPSLPARIAAWMLADRVPARLQLQLHKVVWDPAERGR
jgi:7-carboxy-7-deazaguanine synthase